MHESNGFLFATRGLSSSAPLRLTLEPEELLIQFACGWAARASANPYPVLRVWLPGLGRCPRYLLCFG